MVITVDDVSEEADMVQVKYQSLTSLNMLSLDSYLLALREV